MADKDIQEGLSLDEKFDRGYTYEVPQPQEPMFKADTIQTIFPSTPYYQGNAPWRWRVGVQDYVFPYDAWSLMYMPKLHDVDSIKMGLDHVAQVSTQQGHEARTRYCQENRFSITYLWECVDHTWRDGLRFFYSDYVYGGAKEFWMPIWLEEFACTEGIQAGSNNVKVYPNGYDRLYPNWMYPDLGWTSQALFVRKKNGDQYVRPIVGCTHPEVIVLKEGFPISIPYEDIFLVSRVMRWTFASGLTERWISSINRLDRSGRCSEISATFTVVSGVEDGRGLSVGVDFDDHHLQW